MSHLSAIINNAEGTYRLRPLLAAVIQDTRESLAEMPRWERYVHIFWLLGPFFMLVERTPADIWISVLVLIFVIRSFVIRQGDWLRPFWVRAGFVFWGWCIVAGAISADPGHAVAEAVIWIRFPLFAMATAFWLARDRRMLYAMLLSTTLGLLAMCCILTAELALVGQHGGRLSWPYGDLVSGNYVAKVSLPAFVVMLALSVSIKGRVAGMAAIIATASMFFSVMAGERINFLIRACSGLLAAIVWKPIWTRLLGLAGVVAAGVVGLILMMPKASNRFTGLLIEGATNFENSAWLHTLNGGWVVAKDNLLVGIGTANYRNMAPELLAGVPNTKIDPHPHNFYLQMLLETGIIGLVLGTIFLWSMIWACFRISLKYRDNVYDATAWIIPFGLFWPIATSANFFGQWNNSFMWSAVALAMVVTRQPR